MKEHFLLHQLFNQPHMVLPDMLHEAVAWAGRRMGVQLNQVNVSLPAMSAAAEPHAEVAQAQAATGGSGVAVIGVYGVLVPRSANVALCARQTSYEELRASLNEAVADASVQHIVFDFDSPGGAVTGCFELAADIRAARDMKPITAIVHYSAFSAAYLLASACTEIILSQTSGVGSVGVIMKHADFSKQLEGEGIAVTTFFRGARKNDLAPEAPLSEDAIAVVDQRMDLYYGLFADAVTEYRGLKPEDVRATEAGLYYGADAVKAGLADRVEPQQQAINRIAAEVAASRSKSTPAPRRRMAAQALAMEMAAQL